MRWTYRCPACGTEYPIEPGRYLCDACSSAQLPNRPLEGVLECAWESEDPADAAALATGTPLPVAAEWFPPIPVGGTPLWSLGRLGERLGLPFLFAKDDTCEPTGSFKDRASYLVAAFAREHGIREVALASTGNAASSMSGVGAAAGLKVTVFLPASAPQAKRLQVLQYGAELRPVNGSYDEAFDLSLAYSRETGVLSRNTAYNPLTIEGKKTVSFEIASDLARAGRPMTAGKVPAPAVEVFVPTGDGVIVAGVYRGFEDLLKLGRIARMPRIWACQAEGSGAIVRAFAAGDFGEPVRSSTLADSIAVDAPRNGVHALGKLKKWGGRAIAVSDWEILDAQRLLSSTSGLFCEPSSCAALAGAVKARAELDPSSTVIFLATGSGLKDPKSAARALGLES